jgi:hypothetical protein
MAVADFQTLMLPVLREFADGAARAYEDHRGMPAEFSETSGHCGEFACR